MEWRSRQPAGVLHSPRKIECNCCVEFIYVTEDVVILAMLKQACDESLTEAGRAEKKLGESEVAEGEWGEDVSVSLPSFLLFFSPILD